MRLRPWCSGTITANAMTMLNGITTAATIVDAQLRKKKYNTSVESARPMRIASRRLPIASDTRTP